MIQRSVTPPLFVPHSAAFQTILKKLCCSIDALTLTVVLVSKHCRYIYIYNFIYIYISIYIYIYTVYTHNNHLYLNRLLYSNLLLA